LSEGQPLDEYTLEAGLARLARTGYFEPFEKEGVQIETHEAGPYSRCDHSLHEKGKHGSHFPEDASNSEAHWQSPTRFSTCSVWNEFLSTQIDGGPESLQLAIGLAKEGFLGSRGALALSVFDTFLRPRFTAGPHVAFERNADRER